tara:strand:+ start:284 stop:520 length:237 start_codon:yes stop_codon:yes gene_type:complete
MATQSTTRKAEAEAKRLHQAGLLLQRALSKAFNDNLAEAEQIGWAKIYLAKTMPDLKATELSGGVEVSGQHFIFRKPD